MKTAIIIIDGCKQIVLTPENDSEQNALNLITPNDKVEVAIKQGSFTDKDVVCGIEVNECLGGYLRLWPSDNSIMLVLTPKESKDNAPE